MKKNHHHLNASAKFNVLIVDDSSTIRAILKALLEKAGFKVKEAVNGKQALERIHQDNFDVILLDVMMPELGGFETLEIIRKDPKHTLLPVIILTSKDETHYLIRAFELGASDYLTKPVVKEELLARVLSYAKQKRLIDHLEDAESVLFTLAQLISTRDDKTGSHCYRLAHMAVYFGRYLNLSHDDLRSLRNGGILHDIGKIIIPDAILLKEDKLTKKEWSVIKKHTLVGRQLCEPLKTMNSTLSIIESHHEKWNGSGYPYGLEGEKIPYLARVFQIVDIYDALRSARPYKPAYSFKKTLQVMQTETDKGYWDPNIMNDFFDLVKEHQKELESVDLSDEIIKELMILLKKVKAD
jgi:putative two-component system response regulator